LEEHKDAPSLTIAKIIFTDHPNLFNTIEHARGTVRQYRGVHGEKSRNEIPDKRFFKSTDGSYKIKQVNIKTEDYTFEYKKPLILSDIHLPYHK